MNVLWYKDGAKALLTLDNIRCGGCLYSELKLLTPKGSDIIFKHQFHQKTHTLMSPTLLQNCSPILTEYFDRKWIYQKFWLKSKDFDSVLVTRISMHFLTDYYDEKLIHQRFWWKSEDFDGHHDGLSSHQNAVRHKFWQVFGLSKSIIHSLWRISRKVNLDQRFFESNKFRHKFCHHDHFPLKSTEIFVKKSIKIWPFFVVWSNSFLI